MFLTSIKLSLMVLLLVPVMIIPILAMGRKLKGDNGEVCVFMSDGELQEGQIWEAIQVSVHHGIDNLWAIMDVNSQQVDGAMKDVMDVGNIVKKINAPIFPIIEDKETKT